TGRVASGRPHRARQARHRAHRARADDPRRDCLGAAGRWPHRHPSDRWRHLPQQLGSLRRPRHLGRAVSDREGCVAAAPGGRRLRRVPADRSRTHRGGVQPQPPHRAEADGAVSGVGLKLRVYDATDEDAAIEAWRRTWQQHYPQIDFTARVAWWRERWRKELLPTAIVTMAERDGALVGFVTVDPKTHYLDQIVVAPEAWGSEVAAAL